MRIHETVHIPDQEIEIEVTAEDLLNALFEEDVPRRRELLTDTLNRFARFVRIAPPEMIGEFTPEARKLIHDFFMEQAARYK